MENLRRRRPREPHPRVAHPPGANGPNESDTPEIRAGVEIIWGPFADRMNIAGMTVEAVYRLLQEPLNLAPGVTVQLNGRGLTNPGRQLSEGDTLEFIRPAGEKG